LNNFQGKKIILSLTGSIAAYKAAFLLRLFIKAGADVKVIMSKSASKFISPLTMSTLSKHPVVTDISSDDSWNNHVDLGLWADLMIVAPATANTLGKMANGICDNIVLAVYLSAKCPVFFAPAMDLDMWVHPSTQNNIQKLLSYGNIMIPVGTGELASGLVGAGRMEEPEGILSFLSDYISKEQDLVGKTVLITAGPTYEPIDPVRFIGNRSSGKMGVALAKEAERRGANVNLILGPSKLQVNSSKIIVTNIGTAHEMYESTKSQFAKADIIIFAAAVADYRPKEVADQKIKKKSNEMSIQLEKTIDIAASLGEIKRKNQLTIGFALETNNESSNAQKKLKKKNFDMIVLNSLQDKGAGFNVDTNKIKIFDRKGGVENYNLKSKSAVAQDIFDHLQKIFL